MMRILRWNALKNAEILFGMHDLLRCFMMCVASFRSGKVNEFN